MRLFSVQYVPIVLAIVCAATILMNIANLQGLLFRCTESSAHHPIDEPKKAQETIWVQLTFSLEFEQDLIPHTMNHYLKTLQVDPNHLLVAIHHSKFDPQDMSHASPFTHSEEWMRQEYGITNVLRWTGPYSSDDLWKTRIKHRGMTNINACDWIVKGDSDELPAIPGNSLTSFLDFVGGQGYDSVFGIFNDRVALDGSIANISATPSLNEQFPLSCPVTKKLVRANTQKAVAFRGYHRENRGGHHLLQTTAQEYDDRNSRDGSDHCGYPAVLHIDHYKWTFTVISKLKRRYQVYKDMGTEHAKQSKRIVQHIEKHKGSLSVGDLECEHSPSLLNYGKIYTDGTGCRTSPKVCPTKWDIRMINN